MCFNCCAEKNDRHLLKSSSSLWRTEQRNKNKSQMLQGVWVAMAKLSKIQSLTKKKVFGPFNSLQHSFYCVYVFVCLWLNLKVQLNIQKCKLQVQVTYICSCNKTKSCSVVNWMENNIWHVVVCFDLDSVRQNFKTKQYNVSNILKIYFTTIYHQNRLYQR